MSNYTREDLAQKTALMNQMRNNLYHFLRYLISKGISNTEIRERLERMGKNIAITILENKLYPEQSLEELIPVVYVDLFESNVTVTTNSHQIIVEDKKCSLCRYKREDLTIAPCYVISSLVTEICFRCGYPIQKHEVLKSVALGDISCLHSYTIREDEN